MKPSRGRALWFFELSGLQRVNPAQHFVRATKERVGRRLGSHGFELKPIEEELDEIRAIDWQRCAEWKCDAVRLFSVRTAPEEFNVDLGVYLPVEGRKGTIGDSPSAPFCTARTYVALSARRSHIIFPVFRASQQLARRFVSRIDRQRLGAEPRLVRPVRRSGGVLEEATGGGDALGRCAW